MSGNGTGQAQQKPVAGVRRLIAWILSLRPVRVFQRFGAAGGGLLAAGMSYQALFAIFAALWVGFSVAGFIITADPQLQQSLFDMLNTSAPGLIGENGAIDPALLLNTPILGWTGAIALVGMIATMLGWFASARDAIRRIFHLPGDATPFVLLKLRDLGLVIAFGVALVLSTVVSVVSTSALGQALEWVGIDDDSLFTTFVARGLGLIVVFAFDTGVLMAFYRLLAGVHIPLRRLAAGAVLGAVGLGILKALGSALLGGASRNPLLASFAVIIGLLIWFNLVCQVILLAASWIAVGMADVGLDPRRLSAEEEAARERARQAEARLVLAVAERERVENEVREAGGLRRVLLVRQLKRVALAELRARHAREESVGGAG
ncbi:MAG: YihY/virulence factor BrkB family protein [Microbacteriaceae bacterium]